MRIADTGLRLPALAGRRAGRRRDRHGGAVVEPRGGGARGRPARGAVGLGSPPAPAKASSCYAAYAARGRARAARGSRCAPIGPPIPDLRGLFPSAGRMQRAAVRPARRARRRRRGPAPWLRHGAWPADFFPLRHDVDPQRALRERAGALCLRQRRRRRRARDPGRSDPRRHHRTRPLPLLDRRREGAAARGAARLRAQGHRTALRRHAARRRASARRARVGRLDRRLRVGLRDGGGSRARTCAVPARAAWLRALLLERERVANHLGDLGALGNDGGLAFGLAQFSRLREHWLRTQRARSSAIAC